MVFLQIAIFLLFALPVGASHVLYSLEPDLLVTASALASVGLLSYCLARIVSELKAGAVRNIAGLVLVTSLAAYYFAQFLSYYLQGSYFNQQFYFHFNLATIVETFSVYVPLYALFVGWIICLWLSLLYFNRKLSSSEFSKPVLAVLLLAALALDPGLRRYSFTALASGFSGSTASLDSVDWAQLDLDRGALENATVEATPGKNLVFVFLEGLEKIYTEESIFPGLTPNLNRLNEEGWQLNDLTQVQGSGWTMGGIVSSLCGTPLLYDMSVSGNEILFSRFLDDATCLPDVLSAAGYEQVFMGGASLAFAGKGDFLASHGFDEVYGRDQLRSFLEDPNYLGGWGLFDDSLFSLAARQFDRLAGGDKPFNMTLLTVDTHHPAGEPSASCQPYNAVDNSILHSVHCTDYLVGDFIDQLKQHPAYEDTIVVLVSDHLAMRNNSFSLFERGYDRRLYFNVLNSGISVPPQMTATPMDIAPTVLELLGVDHEAKFLAGINLLRESNSIAVRNTNSSSRQEAIKFINSNFLSTAEDTVHYSLGDSDLSEINFSSHVSNAALEDGELTFESTGNDPYFILPSVSISENDDARLYIDFESPGSNSISLYYPTDENSGYSEQNKLNRNTTRGRNQAIFSLKNSAKTGRFRIDIDGNTGRTTITSIEIRS